MSGNSRFKIKEELTLNKLEVSKRKLKSKVPMYGFPKGLISINANLLWKEGFTGRDVKVAVIDSGIDTHSDLRDNIVYRRSYVGKIDDDHGTHVASIIAANAKDSSGIYGVAPNAKLYDLQVLRLSGGSEENYVHAINKAIELDVDIINCSLGTEYYHQKLIDATEKACAAGIIVVAASGNKGMEAELYPAMVPDVISVTNFDLSNYKVNKLSTINDRVDLTSPGTDIYGCSFNDDYVVYTGTSTACPHISGICALLIEYVRSKHGNISKREVKEIVTKMLMSNLIDIPPVGYDKNSGFGFFRYHPEIEPKFDYLGDSKYYYLGLKLEN